MLEPASALRSLLWVNNTPPYGETTVYLSIRQLIEHLGCLHFVVIVSYAAVNICVQVLTWTYVFLSLGDRPVSGIAGPYGNPMFNFEGESSLLNGVVRRGLTDKMTLSRHLKVVT